MGLVQVWNNWTNNMSAPAITAKAAAAFRQRTMAVRVSGAAGVPVPARRNANSRQSDHAMSPARDS
jgi:hypothetical protein